jgi:macrolide transport system ATP-binding/permease protein
LHVPGRVSVPLLDIRSGMQLLLTGPNGSGKSSLLAVLAGRLRPGSGSVQVAAGRIGLLEQDVVFPDPEASALTTFTAALAAGPGGGSDGEAADQLAGFGLLRPREIGAPVGTLSVGQRRRLALAILLARSPDLVLLDEPTNHISLGLAAELEDALGVSPGTVVVASHDRWLRRRWDGSTYAMSRG